MKKSIFLLLVLCTSVGYSQKRTLTDSLTQVFNTLWDAYDIEEMYKMLQPDAFFKSPFQLRYGRDTMRATVLKWNPLKFKNSRSIEIHSHVEKDMCYSLGTLTFGIYDAKGVYTGKDQASEYIYFFTRNKRKEWKIQAMIFYEEKKP